MNVPFRLKLTGDTSDQHQFQGYDGYMALAGFARALSLVTNYVETGKIRVRGDFEGRHAVRARALDEGSVVADFFVILKHTPIEVFGIAAGITLTSANLLYSLFNRIVDGNLGIDRGVEDEAVAKLIAARSGDIEALVALSEAPIRQTHALIGNGADKIVISSGFNIVNTFDNITKEYVNQNIEENILFTKAVSVSSFSAISGTGSVFDSDIGRVVPVTMSRDTLTRCKSVFSWGLDQYVNGTGNKINIEYTRIMAMDGRAKKYVVSAAHH